MVRIVLMLIEGCFLYIEGICVILFSIPSVICIIFAMFNDDEEKAMFHNDFVESMLILHTMRKNDFMYRYDDLLP